MQAESQAPRSARLAAYLAADPGNASLRMDLFDALMAEGRHDTAAQVAADASQRLPAEGAWRYRLGVAQARAGDFADAERTLSALLGAWGAQAPPALLHELAQLHLRRGDDEGAAELLFAIAEDEGHAAAFATAELALLRVLHRNGRLDDALAVGQRALARRPGAMAIRAALATAAIDADRFELLAATLDGVDLQAAEAPARAELAAAQGYLRLQQGDTRAAAAAFESSLQAAPDSPRARLGLGLALASQGGAGAGAEAALREAVAGMPGHLGSWHALGWIQLARGELEAAESTFAQVLALDDTFAESHAALAVVAALRGDTPRARGLLRTAQRLDRDSPTALAAQLVLRHGSLGSPALQREGLAALARLPGIGARLRGLPGEVPR